MRHLVKQETIISLKKALRLIIITCTFAIQHCHYAKVISFSQKSLWSLMIRIFTFLDVAKPPLISQDLAISKVKYIHTCVFCVS